MKTLSTLVTLCTLSLVLSSCGTGGYTKYTGVSGIEFEYPSSWKANKEIGWYISFQNEKTKAIIVAGKQKVVTPKTNDEIFEFYKSRWALSISDTLVGGVPGKYVEYTNVVWQYEFYHKEAWKNVWEDIYTVACTLRWNEKATDIEWCNHVIETLK